MTAFVRAFELLGYSLCADGDLVAGVEKVVLYTGQQGTPKHMARQLESGLWTSKLGGWVDIEHTSLTALEGGDYGYATHFMKRPR